MQTLEWEDGHDENGKYEWSQTRNLLIEFVEFFN